jgi:hypothetical protein
MDDVKNNLKLDEPVERPGPLPPAKLPESARPAVRDVVLGMFSITESLAVWMFQNRQWIDFELVGALLQMTVLAQITWASWRVQRLIQGEVTRRR